MPHSIPAAAGAPDRIDAAKTLLRAGKAAEAEQMLRKMVDQDSPEALGLLALLEMQRGRIRKAKQLWTQALGMPSPAWIFHNNLHNLLAVLLKEGAKAEAARHAALAIPPWPALRAPSPEERNTVPALADMLAGLGQLDSAAGLLESFVPQCPRDGVLLHALGRLHLARGDRDAAWRTLTEAERVLQPKLSFPLLADLCSCARARRDLAAERALTAKVAAASPICILPAKASQRANVLVLNKVQFVEARSEPELHFHGNFPGQMARHLSDEYRFMSVFGDEPAGWAARDRLPAPGVIINNIASAEWLQSCGNQGEIAAFADSFGVPVINHPDKIARTARDAVAALLADVPNLVVPRIGRFAKAGRPASAVADEIEAGFGYPLIARTLDLQQGLGMVKVDGRGQLLQAIDTTLPEDFFVTEFIDSRGASGLHRKVRAAAVGDQVFVMRVDWDHHWMVHGRKSDDRVAFYRNNRHLLAEEDRICADPDQVLQAPVMGTLEAIRTRMPLDIYGVDFDVMADGRLVLYEANATMNLFSGAVPDIRSPERAHQRTLAAMREYIDARLK